MSVKAAMPSIHRAVGNPAAPDPDQQKESIDVSQESIEITNLQPNNIFDNTFHFVNRTSIIEKIDEKISLLKFKDQIHPQSVIINIYGIPGIGKSALLQHIYNKYIKDPDIVVLAYSHKPSDESQPIELQSHLIARLGAQISSHTELPTGTTPTLAILADIFVAYSIQHPVLLLLDDCEQMSSTDLDWLEQDLLRRVQAKPARTAIVLSSQSEILWKSFDVRRRVQRIELQALSAEDTAQQVEDLNQLSEAVYALSRGYPLATKYIHDALQQQAPAHELDETRRKELLEQVVQAIQHRLTAQNSDDFWQVVQVVALLREFDMESLQALLPKATPGRSAISQTLAFHFIRRLVASRLCRADEAIHVYRMATPVRLIIAEVYRFQRPEVARAVHAAAAQMYRERLGQAPRSRNRHLVEYYYHQTIYKTLGETYNAEEMLDDVKILLETCYVSSDRKYRDETELAHLATLFTNDHELQGLLQVHGLSITRIEKIIQDIKEPKTPDDKAATSDP